MEREMAEPGAFHIGVLAGDGIGPEVTAAARTVLNAVGALYDRQFVYEDGLMGGAAIDATGEPLPAATLDLCRRSDAILFGAIGGPKWERLPGAQRPERGLLDLRQSLGLFANLRPV